MTFSRRSAGSVALEATLIVASILLAFAIDAAWDGREQARRERDLLMALRADFQRNELLLEDARSIHLRYRSAAVSFLEHTAPGAAPATGAVPDDVLIGLVSWHTYDPILGSLGSAIASGQLALIRDDGLRALLAGWVDSVEDLNELEIVDREHAQRFADVAFDVMAFRSAAYRLGLSELVRPSTAPEGGRQLLGSLRAENIASNRVAEIGFILEDLDRVEAELEAILTRLESNLR